MRQVEASRSVPATPERVFSFVADLDNLPRWQTGIVSAERTYPDPIGIGSTARVVRELMGQRIQVELRVTDYQPPHRLALASEASGVGVHAALDLQEDGEGSLVRFSMEIRAQNIFMAPMEGMIAGAASSDLAASLDRLQAALSET
ncbi:MAG TPA: SRPBCC family protein [Candidatus Limnocylindria bacterium]|nr:SRPBCC family protein [Candidatus Limnocylindria bacterium]